MERCSFNAVNRTLTITEAFRAKMQDMESDEFKYYSRMMADIPGLHIVQRTHRTPAKYTTKNGETFSCNPNKNLKYKNMEAFISGLPNSSQYMKEYRFLKERAAIVQTSRYKLVRDWFVAQFPEFRTNPLAYIFNAPTPIDAESFVANAADAHNQAATMVQ